MDIKVYKNPKGWSPKYRGYGQHGTAHVQILGNNKGLMAVLIRKSLKALKL